MSKHHATNHACLGAHAQSCTFFLSGVSVQVMIGAEQQNLSQQSTRTPQNGTGRDRVNVVGSAVEAGQGCKDCPVAAVKTKARMSQ
jgi:hypothetical protein